MTRVAAGGALAVVLLIAAPALACTPKAGFTADPGRAQAGAAVHLTGNNFNADGMPVKIHWSAAESGTERVLMSVPVDGGGSFQASVTIPADARPGSYVLRAKQVGSAYEPARIQFQVLEPGEVPQQPAPPSGSETPSPNNPPGPPGASPPPQPAPASQAADTTPVASSPAAPAAPAAAPRRAAATADPVATAPAAPAASVETAAPAAPAAPVEAVAEPTATPSVKSTTSDLWSGFNGRSAGQVPSLAAPVERAPADSMAGGIALLVVGTLTLLGGAGVAGIRRTRRVHA